MARPIPKGNLPDLVLQEVHVPIQQCVGRGENAHGLHAGTTLQLTLHRHVGKAGQAKTEPFPEITGDKGLTEGSMLKRRRKKGNRVLKLLIWEHFSPVRYSLKSHSAS